MEWVVKKGWEPSSQHRGLYIRSCLFLGEILPGLTLWKAQLDKVQAAFDSIFNTGKEPASRATGRHLNTSQATVHLQAAFTSLQVVLPKFWIEPGRMGAQTT